jgi:hypothetical protein
MSTSRPEFLCVLCSQSVDLSSGFRTDEPGKAVHEECYFNRFVAKSDTTVMLPRLHNAFEV